MPTVYTDIPGITELQNGILDFVKDWVKTQKTPVPQKEILKKFVTGEVKDFTVIHAINALMRQQYLRRSFIISNKTFYTMMRTV